MKKTIFFAFSLLMLTACSDDPASSKNQKYTCAVPSSCDPANGTSLEVVCPTADAEFAPGDTMWVRWRVQMTEYTGFRPRLSLDGGKTYQELSDSSVWNGPTPEVQCLNYPVVIPADGSWTLNGNNSQVMVQVRDYSAPNSANMYDNSALFTIQAP